jgi:Uma2 family endonuclease/FtsZ-binding cell division protein ZapB
MLATENIIYPDSDGQPMADNTRQFRWISVIKYNLDWLFAEDPNVFVAGDLLWYPIEGEPKRNAAPDVMVVFGRPKGDRGSYKQWEEGNLAPQVVFEILSPSNTASEMMKKMLFYNRHGVEEYYIYDPDAEQMSGYQRGDDLDWEPIAAMQDWVSPRLGIRFHLAETLELFDHNGQLFRSFEEVSAENNQLQDRNNQLQDRNHQLQDRNNQLQDENAKLAEKLRELGIEPQHL